MKSKILKILLFISALLTLLLMAGMLYSLIVESLLAFKHFGFFNFITSSDWNPREDQETYGGLSFIIGTAYTAILALLISFPFSLSLTLFCGKYYKEGKITKALCKFIDLLAHIPSILLGIWGYFCLRPILIFLGMGNQGFGIFTVSFVLAIMIIPYISSLCINSIAKVPQSIKEAAYSLGATHIEVIGKIELPFIKKEIFAAYLLALGKALGETMIVTILIGNMSYTPSHITDMGNTITSIIISQIGAAGDLKFSSLLALALLLFLLTSIINFIAKQIMGREVL